MSTMTAVVVPRYCSAQGLFVLRHSSSPFHKFSGSSLMDVIEIWHSI